MKKTFEEFLRDKCPDILQTNNSPEGEDRWLENLDGSEYEELGQEYGEMMYELGQKDGIKMVSNVILKTQEMLMGKL